jgi:hypothetical protein
MSVDTSAEALGGQRKSPRSAETPVTSLTNATSQQLNLHTPTNGKDTSPPVTGPEPKRGKVGLVGRLFSAFGSSSRKGKQSQNTECQTAADVEKMATAPDVTVSYSSSPEKVMNMDPPPVESSSAKVRDIEPRRVEAPPFSTVEAPPSSSQGTTMVESGGESATPTSEQKSVAAPSQPLPHPKAVALVFTADGTKQNDAVDAPAQKPPPLRSQRTGPKRNGTGTGATDSGNGARQLSTGQERLQSNQTSCSERLDVEDSAAPPAPQYTEQEVCDAMDVCEAMFGVVTMRNLQSSKWGDRKDGMMEMQATIDRDRQKMKESGDNNDLKRLAGRAFSACCVLLKRGFEDPVAPVYFACCDCFKALVKAYGPSLAPSSGSGSSRKKEGNNGAALARMPCLIPLIPCLLEKMNDSNRRTQREACRCLLQIARMYNVGGMSILAPFIAQNGTPVRPRLNLLRVLVNEFQFEKGSGLSLGLTMSVALPALNVADAKTRKAGIAVIECTHLYVGKRILKHLKDVKPVMMNILQRKFEEQKKTRAGGAITEDAGDSNLGGEELDPTAETENRKEYKRKPLAPLKGVNGARLKQLAPPEAENPHDLERDDDFGNNDDGDDGEVITGLDLAITGTGFLKASVGGVEIYQPVKKGRLVGGNDMNDEDGLLHAAEEMLGKTDASALGRNLKRLMLF